MSSPVNMNDEENIADGSTGCGTDEGGSVDGWPKLCIHGQVPAERSTATHIQEDWAAA